MKSDEEIDSKLMGYFIRRTDERLKDLDRKLDLLSDKLDKLEHFKIKVVAIVTASVGLIEFILKYMKGGS